MTATIPTAERGHGTDPDPGAERAAEAHSLLTEFQRPRYRLARFVRPGLALVAVVVAFRVSLQTLLEDFTLDTPLAHLALVPFIAVGLMVIGHRRAAGPEIHDRQLDWIVGLPLLLMSLTANVVLPGRLSTEFWVYRIDLLSLPFFAAGAVVLIFGLRAAWEMRSGLAFLFLAWTYPFAQMLDRWLEPFTALTVHAVTAAVHVIAVAAPYPGDNTNALFTVTPRSGPPFDLSVATECSGANGLVGFFLVGIAFLLVLEGPTRHKVLWLASGGLLVWALNVVRILLIFWVGERWGETVAIDGFHPFIGLVVFNAGLLLMALLLRRFGLSWPQRAPGPDPFHATRPGYRPAMAAGAIVVGLTTGGIAALNSDLQNYDLVASSLGGARLTSFGESQERPGQWNLQFADVYDWSKRYFGANSNWSRYVYTDPQPFAAGSELHANAAIIADVITTDDRSAFSAYGIEACYRFHDFRITKRQSVDLGNGVVGGLLTWFDPATRSTTTTLYWHWPIKNGEETRWERMTLLVIDNPSLEFHIPNPPPEDLTREFQLRVQDVLVGDQGDGGEMSARLVATRQFLVAFGQDLIAERASASSEAGPAGGGQP
ncbi:MAG: exosortase/archaeosortase family protein [Acidimicrobiales bacterium]